MHEDVIFTSYSPFRLVKQMDQMTYLIGYCGKLLHVSPLLNQAFQSLFVKWSVSTGMGKKRVSPILKTSEISNPVLIVRWIENYLLERQQYVVVKGEESSLSSPVVSGVAQGSVGPPTSSRQHKWHVEAKLVWLCHISFGQMIVCCIRVSCMSDFSVRFHVS